VLSFGAGPAPVNVPHAFVMAPYNDLARTEPLIAANADALAAILVEPMLGAGGCIPGTREFLAGLRHAATRIGAVLIFDEVMTSRLSPGGRQAELGLAPDLTTLGKYIGGGSSFGAFGGRADIMRRFDPREPGALTHAGTFNTNVISMAAGVAGMTKVLTPEAIRALNARGDALRDGLNALFRRRGARLQATGLGSVIGLHGTDRPLRNPDDGAGADPAIKDLLFFDLVARGFYIARRGFIALSLPLTDADIASFLAGMDDIVASRAALLARD
jgi:glutamate-1-semialdehyde 2,1-aminomutase